MSAISESVRNNIKKVAAGAVGFFTFILLYVHEFSWYANTFDRNKLIITGVIIGLAVGLAIGYKLKDKSREIIGKFQICLGMMMVGAIVTPLVFGMSNRLLSFGGIEEESVEFVKNEGFKESRFGQIPQENLDGYYTFVVRNGEVLRLTTRIPIYEKAQKGEKVILPVKKGLWGFEIAYPHLLHE